MGFHQATMAKRARQRNLAKLSDIDLDANEKTRIRKARRRGPVLGRVKNR
ncbi:hypothetical protein WN51_04334 [Melipona quadrifasciata]|uniref:Uncharacterized protein n=1 Tax=Melipona quadrifasciata TaxID=166423 RepID=A0A0M8ZR77_9HYME|nr:hypothetical protein WN51_04334 [Melipona quadrifasciata]